MTDQFSVVVTIEAILWSAGSHRTSVVPTSGIARVASRDEHGNLVEFIALNREAKALEVGTTHTVAGHQITRYAGLRGPWDSSLEDA